jgi:hypothetical protein
MEERRVVGMLDVQVNIVLERDTPSKAVTRLSHYVYKYRSSSWNSSYKKAASLGGSPCGGRAGMECTQPDGV